MSQTPSKKRVVAKSPAQAAKSKSNTPKHRITDPTNYLATGKLKRGDAGNAQNTGNIRPWHTDCDVEHMKRNDNTSPCKVFATEGEMVQSLRNYRVEHDTAPPGTWRYSSGDWNKYTVPREVISEGKKFGMVACFRVDIHYMARKIERLDGKLICVLRLQGLKPNGGDEIYYPWLGGDKGFSSKEVGTLLKASKTFTESDNEGSVYEEDKSPSLSPKTARKPTTSRAQGINPLPDGLSQSPSAISKARYARKPSLTDNATLTSAQSATNSTVALTQLTQSVSLQAELHHSNDTGGKHRPGLSKMYERATTLQLKESLSSVGDKAEKDHANETAISTTAGHASPATSQALSKTKSRTARFIKDTLVMDALGARPTGSNKSVNFIDSFDASEPARNDTSTAAGDSDDKSVSTQTRKSTKRKASPENEAVQQGRSKNRKHSLILGAEQSDNEAPISSKVKTQTPRRAKIMENPLPASQATSRPVLEKAKPMDLQPSTPQATPATSHTMSLDSRAETPTPFKSLPVTIQPNTPITAHNTAVPSVMQSASPTKQPTLTVKVRTSSTGIFTPWAHGLLSTHTLASLFEHITESYALTTEPQALRFDFSNSLKKDFFVIAQDDQEAYSAVILELGKAARMKRFVDGVFWVDITPVMEQDDEEAGEDLVW